MKRWIIRSFFIALLLLGVGGWVLSYWELAAIQLNRPAWREIAIYRGRVYLAGSGNTSYHFPFFKTESITGTPWSYDLPTHDWFIARIGGERYGYWFLGLPMWLFIGLLTLFTFGVWRKTRPKAVGRAFPVEMKVKENKP